MHDMEQHRARPSQPRVVFVVLIALAMPGVPLHQDTGGAVPGHVIRGRVVDPHQLRPKDAVLMLGHEMNGGFGSVPVSTAADGSFVTRPVAPGTYVLQLVRTPHSTTSAATPVGLAAVRVDTSDVSGVSVEVRRDTALTGRFRMETDRPGTAWPQQIVVNAILALDGMPSLDSVGAEGAAAGRFVLHNAFGPRVLRCGYTLAPGAWWWPSHVLLDGVDVTNVPTDFSAHENGQLEIVFVAHPARITGTVVDSRGNAVRGPWIVVVAADAARRQEWATTSDVAQGDTVGRFSLPARPGRYLVTAFVEDRFESRVAARRQILRFGSRGVPVDVQERRDSTVTLTVP
jgi:hypothetical protein